MRWMRLTQSDHSFGLLLIKIKTHLSCSLFQSLSLFDFSGSHSGQLSLDLIWFLWNLVQRVWIRPETWDIKLLIGIYSHIVHDRYRSQQVKCELDVSSLVSLYWRTPSILTFASSNCDLVKLNLGNLNSILSVLFCIQNWMSLTFKALLCDPFRLTFKLSFAIFYSQ